jgi:uncharacterized FlgJ-related protein
MTPILELIKHLGLGIVSLLLFIGVCMADIGKTKEFMNLIKEVRNEYPEDSIERKIPISFVATVAAAETGNFKFENAPTAKAANNFFGMHASSNYMKDNPDKFMTTTGGANLRTFNDSKDSIRGFLQLITSDERYKNVVDSSSKVEDMFKGMSPYATREDYTDFLANVYKDNIKPIIETENMLVPKIKPMFQQMNNLK